MNEELQSAFIRISPFIVLILIIYIFLRLQRFNRFDLGINKPVSSKAFLTWWGFFLVFILITELVMYSSGLLESDPWNHPLFPTIIRIFGAVVLAPVAEELFFRGLLIYRLKGLKMNIHVVIFIQAVLFVLSHSFAYENTLSSNIGTVQTFIDGTLYGYARYHTRSIYTSTAMHMTGNIIATLERFIL